ncbi:MAG: folate family ECF transporter S component [Tissierellia bacterium]|nr:folate family ECF transporter S component [Tissierellia bacterium]
MRNHEKNKVQVIAYSAILMALSIVLTRMFSIMIPIPGIGNSLRVGFGAIPTIIAGLLFGPVAGGIVGGGSDIIGVLINPMGPAIHPGFTFTAMLTGIIPGLVVGAYGKKLGIHSIQVLQDKKYLTRSIIMTVVLRAIIVEMILNTIWLTNLMGASFVVLFPPRAVKAIAILIIHGLILRGIMGALKEAGVLKSFSRRLGTKTA